MANIHVPPHPNPSPLTIGYVAWLALLACGALGAGARGQQQAMPGHVGAVDGDENATHVHGTSGAFDRSGLRLRGIRRSPAVRAANAGTALPSPGIEAGRVSARTVGGLVPRASAEPNEHEKRSAHEGVPKSITLARVCFLESGWRESDCSAIYHVAKHRAQLAGWSVERMLVKYSAIDADNPRAREIRTYPDGDVPGESVAFNRRWAALRAYAVRVVAGEVANPCKGASDWGAPNLPNDVARAQRAIDAGKWVLARCSRPTANRFYATKGGGL